MNGQDFLRISKEIFLPFLMDLGFSIDDPSISGRFYRVSFRNASNVVLISYEPGDDALFVIIFSIRNGILSDIDDRKNTPRLEDLSRIYMPFITPKERMHNQFLFNSVVAIDRESRLLLRAAKELRLVLPKYLKDTAK